LRHSIKWLHAIQVAFAQFAAAIEVSVATVWAKREVLLIDSRDDPVVILRSTTAIVLRFVAANATEEFFHRRSLSEHKLIGEQAKVQSNGCHRRLHSADKSKRRNMHLLSRQRIRSALKGIGKPISDKQLKQFLDSVCDYEVTIPRLRIKRRGVGVDDIPASGKPHAARWYDIVSPEMDAESANQMIVEYLSKRDLD
jgi:hypothetical protein